MSGVVKTKRSPSRRADQPSVCPPSAVGAPALFQRFVDERWNHFRFPDVADQPSALFHHLVWLRHAGFTAVDGFWLNAGHAVFGGFKPAAASAPPLPADN